MTVLPIYFCQPRGKKDFHAQYNFNLLLKIEKWRKKILKPTARHVEPTVVLFTGATLGAALILPDGPFKEYV
jgi:hypothetical protein